MRQGVPMAGNHLMTELAIVTGAVEMVIVDYQCIMPSLVNVAGCYHTKFVSTSDKARFPGGQHMEFHVANARDKAREAVLLAVDAFTRRDPAKVEIPPYYPDHAVTRQDWAQYLDAASELVTRMSPDEESFTCRSTCAGVLLPFCRTAVYCITKVSALGRRK